MEKKIRLPGFRAGWAGFSKQNFFGLVKHLRCVVLNYDYPILQDGFGAIFIRSKKFITVT